MVYPETEVLKEVGVSRKFGCWVEKKAYRASILDAARTNGKGQPQAKAGLTHTGKVLGRVG